MFLQKFKIPIYDKSFYLLVTSSIDDVKKEIKGYEYDDFYGECITIKEKKNTKTYIILREDACKSEIVAHECIHLTYGVLDEVGIPYDYINQENFAYLFEYIFKEVCDILKQAKLLK